MTVLHTETVSVFKKVRKNGTCEHFERMGNLGVPGKQVSECGVKKNSVSILPVEENQENNNRENISFPTAITTSITSEGPTAHDENEKKFKIFAGERDEMMYLTFYDVFVKTNGGGVAYQECRYLRRTVNFMDVAINFIRGCGGFSMK